MNLNEFKKYLEEDGKSENTIKTYVKALTRYSEWFKETYDLEVEKVFRENVLEYRSYLKNVQKLSYSSINNSLVGIKKYNEFLVDNDLQDGIVIDKKVMLKVQKKVFKPDQFDELEIKQFIQKILESGNKRNYAIVMLMAYSGLRISEALNIKLSDYDFVSGRLDVYGKGDKHRITILNDNTIEAVRSYLKTRDTYLKSEDSEYLFLSKRSDKLDPSSINRLFNKYSNSLTPHSLRHFFCTLMLKNGFSLDEVAGLAGHESLETTRIYLNPSYTELRDKINSIG